MCGTRNFGERKSVCTGARKRNLKRGLLLQLERLRSANESWKFYKRINNQRKGFNSRMTICIAVNGTLLTAKHDVLKRFKQYFNALYNGDIEDANVIDDSFLNDDGRIVSAPTLEEVSELTQEQQIFRSGYN